MEVVGVDFLLMGAETIGAVRRIFDKIIEPEIPPRLVKGMNELGPLSFNSLRRR